MAVDTQEKRMSAAGAGRVFMRATFPVGATDEQSRVGKGIAYNGNALTPAAGGFVVAWARNATITLGAGVTTQ